jgi:hypothetical protein
MLGGSGRLGKWCDCRTSACGVSLQGVGFEGLRSTDSAVRPSVVVTPEPLRTSFYLVPVPSDRLKR